MTVIGTVERPDTHDMVVVHRVFRRESGLLPRLARAVPAGDTARAALVATHFRGYQLGLHHHHTGEDELLWPLLLARVDLEAELVLRMEAQHQVVAATLERAESLLETWKRTATPADGESLAAVLEEHRTALLEHLADEERYILPLVEEHLTAQEWNRLGERFATETPKDKLLLFLGALLEEATPEERAHMLGNVPLPARIVWWVYGRRKYAREVGRLRSVLPG
jgi:iron-sulfur cluster repair protein YtfE (RIC family)